MGEIRRIAVVGAGEMGTGIAHVAALAGFDVVLADLGPEQLAQAQAAIARNMDRQIAKGLIDGAAKAATLARIAAATDLAALADRDLIIEAVTENEQVKLDLYRRLRPVLRPEACIATNASSISISRLAAATDRPARFMGVHFMNPVPVMQLVELVRAIPTAQETFDAVRAMVVAMNKIPVEIGDFPPFIVNRILMPMINEAVYALFEGAAGVAAIDTAMRLGARHPMGPLELADFIGLDNCLALMRELYQGLADVKYRPCPLLEKYVQSGRLGRKSKCGFYDYTGETPVPTR
jgi:3-hydroxybutyryl-CoA dehydrogenase